MFDQGYVQAELRSKSLSIQKDYILENSAEVEKIQDSKAVELKRNGLTKRNGNDKCDFRSFESKIETERTKE